MKKRFEKQEERIDEKFKDISATMEKNQDKRQKADDDPVEGVKRARKESSNFEYNKYMNELDEKILDTQSVGTPCQRDSPAPSTKHRGAGRSAD
eukprot:7705851-Ditylum_brightwellii.AAC.1